MQHRIRHQFETKQNIRNEIENLEYCRNQDIRSIKIIPSSSDTICVEGGYDDYKCTERQHGGDRIVIINFDDFTEVSSDRAMMTEDVLSY